MTTGTLSSCGTEQADGGGSATEEEPQLESVSEYFAYRTLTSLAQESDVVVRGRVAELLTQNVDQGGTDVAGIPMLYYRVEVSEVLAGSIEASSVVVGWKDAERSGDDELSDLAASSSVVLYLESVTRDAAPGIPPEFDRILVPLSGDNGVFDVRDSEAVARSKIVTGVLAPGDGFREGQLMVVALDTLARNAAKFVKAS